MSRTVHRYDRDVPGYPNRDVPGRPADSKPAKKGRKGRSGRSPAPSPELVADGPLGTDPGESEAPTEPEEAD